MVKNEPIKLEKVECWNEPSTLRQLTGLRLTLSNGTKSQKYTTTQGCHNHKIMKFKEGSRPRTLTTMPQPHSTLAFKFHDADGNEVLSWVGSDEAHSYMEPQ